MDFTFIFFTSFQPNLSEMLSYCTNLCTRMLQHKGLREDILRLLVRLHSNLEPTSTGTASQPDYINICQCLIYLDDPASVSDILRKLIRGDQVRKNDKVCKLLYGMYIYM